MHTALGSQFEEKLLKVASNFVTWKLNESMDYSKTISDTLKHYLPEGSSVPSNYYTLDTYTTITSISSDELERWNKAYASDPFLSKSQNEDNAENDFCEKYTQYQVWNNGLIYFEDWNGNYRLVVPESLQVDIMSQVHNTITEAAHGGYAKTYNQIAAIYYWPRMSRDIKKYIGTCNISQKTKLRHHVPIGMLQPIPIPSQPFEVVSMDFIPELPESSRYNNILVIIDKLTKYAIFILTTTSITKKGTAELFFRHMIAQYGIPRQVISDWDVWWRGKFWKEICDQMGMKRALTMAYYPQANEQTKIMNQMLEISPRAYIGPDWDDWVLSLDGLALSYNSTPHTTTRFAPAYLLRGYVPITGSCLIHLPESIQRPLDWTESKSLDDETLRPEATEMIEQFKADRQQAQEALLLARQTVVDITCPHMH